MYARHTGCLQCHYCPSESFDLPPTCRPTPTHQYNYDHTHMHTCTHNVTYILIQAESKVCNMSWCGYHFLFGPLLQAATQMLQYLRQHTDEDLSRFSSAINLFSPSIWAGLLIRSVVKKWEYFNRFSSLWVCSCQYYFLSGRAKQQLFLVIIH